MHVYLIGFMGAGKSTVGSLLADLLGRPFVDLDKQIEVEAGKSISKIFEMAGEAAFRRLETDTLSALSDRVSVVVAVGGGAMAVADNRDQMRRTGKTVWLDVPFAVLSDRLAATGTEARPLFTDETSTQKLYDARLASYRQSDHRIEVSSEDDPQKVVQAIIEALKEQE